MTPIVGHDRQMAQLGAALKAGKLHHAIILAGPRGAGKASFAAQFAAQIVDPEGQHSALTSGGTHPDIITIERPFKDDLKEGETRDPGDERKRSIAVDQIRKLQSRLATKAGLSNKRAIIIDAADDMSKEPSNALLKSLEEPPSGCHFLLVSHASEQLLPTIRSRCQMLHFDRLSENQMRQVLQQVRGDMPPEELEALLQVGDGLPGQALEFAGLDIAEIEGQIRQIIDSSDPDNAIRSAMASKLSLKSAQQRYEAFLRRVPTIIAAFARDCEADNALPAVEAYQKASTLAQRATALTLDKKAVVAEMGSLLAALNAHKQAA